LPLLSREAVEGKINGAIWRITKQMMIPSAIALITLVILRNLVLQLLYSDQIELSLDVALYFWVGEAARILSAIFLMGLFVLHATKLITIWDFFSQPLFVMLLFFGMSISLELTGLAYLLTYLLYSALCIVGFMWVERKSRIA
jgi:O-antigen/teichoic acid export membrane protein